MVFRGEDPKLEQWQELWAELPLEDDGTRLSAAAYGEILREHG